ncbi:Na+/Pi symporter [Mortierella polycephala]|uniref:Phosphate transporter n=1 Tax=Mortierella polycephala TaxID=41804 RepID=A0A9P6Q9U2_9FUNG|nr:Na+/Pi symporter [Mortierella polycephala]
MEVHDYTFLFGIGLVFAFMDAFGIGANDVANSFATSVGSGSITLAQALCIAAVMEFGGAVLLGANTSETIKGGIVETALYKDTPEILMLTMVCALVGSSTWVLFASSRGWPVSTTHAIVGAITGAAISAFGADGVQWSGIGKIVLSWVISPVASGLVCSIIFLITRFAVLKHADSFRRGLIAIPIYFGIALTVNVFYIIFKGAPRSDLRTASIGIPVGIALGVGFAVFLWCFVFLRPYLRRKIMDNEDLHWYHMFFIPFVAKREKAPVVVEEAAQKGEKGVPVDGSSGQADPSLIELEAGEKTFGQKLKTKLFYGLNQEVRVVHDDTENSVHAHATKFDPDTERLFSAVQVISACFTSFAHGSNDVANAIGPLATIYYIWQNANADVAKAPVPIWILVFGGFAIDIGLMTYGYHVMRTLGNKITYMSPTRGFSAEMGTSITILTCSKLSLPVSSTHCITGATTAIGLLSGGGFKSLNWRLLLGIFASWILTLPAAGLTSGIIFAFVSRSPQLV